MNARFVDTVNAADLYEKAARGLVNQLQDPYSELMSPKQLTQFNTTTAGRYGGIGMRIEEQPGKGVTIVTPVSHAPGGWSAEFKDPEGHVLSIYQSADKPRKR